MKLSKTLHLRQLLRSETAERYGIPNRPRFADLRRLRATALALDRVRRVLGRPLVITSGYRSEALNRRVGGAPRSQHVRGEAVDFVCPAFGPPLEVARALKRAGVRYDQLIYEFGCRADGGWLHISFSPLPRRRVLTICSTRRGYRLGLHPCRST